MVCVKIDLRACRGHHFLGVKFQAVTIGNLTVVPAAVTEVTERAIVAEIRSTQVACLEKGGIREQQIDTLTTGNSSSVVKVG